MNIPSNIRASLNALRQKKHMPAHLEDTVAKTLKPNIDPAWEYDTSDRPKSLDAHIWNTICFSHRETVMLECARKLRSHAANPSTVAAETSNRLYGRDVSAPETLIGKLSSAIHAGYGKNSTASLKRAKAALRKAREAHAILVSIPSELDRFISAVIPDGDDHGKANLRVAVFEVANIENDYRKAYLVRE
ncbi:hypothetical protein [Dongia sp.]|uniref:hypothetical protein n=1 Tax=Dongia sp. TaxID=1977262 RepID=UPI0035B02034